MATLAGTELQVTRRTVEISERGEVTSYLVTRGTNQFSVVPPPRWRVTTNPNDDSLTFSPRDLSASVTLRIIETGTNTIQVTNTAYLREQMLGFLPESSVTRQFCTFSGAGEGAVWDLERIGKGNALLATRHVAVPLKGAVVTFTLSTPASRFEKFTLPLSTMVTSLKQEKAIAPPP